MARLLSGGVIVAAQQHAEWPVVLVLLVEVEPVLHAYQLGPRKVGDVVVARLYIHTYYIYVYMCIYICM